MTTRNKTDFLCKKPCEIRWKRTENHFLISCLEIKTGIMEIQLKGRSFEGMECRAGQLHESEYPKILQAVALLL
jgi:hypothetical protein